MKPPASPVYSSQFNRLPVQTGDILCTHDGVVGSLFGQFWHLMGKLTPGEVDHCLLYLGPGGRCVESALRGVLVFEMPGEKWDAKPLEMQRRILDSLVGVAYPLSGLHLAAEEEDRIRTNVARFCLDKVTQNKPYNLNFFDPKTDGAYYCSQLIYKAYLTQGIDLNTNQGVPSDPLLGRVVFPMEIWNGLPHRQVE